MEGLSRRARLLVESPPLAAYIAAHFERVAAESAGQAFDKRYVPLCIAENKRQSEALARYLGTLPPAPPEVLGYDAMIGNAEFRQQIAGLMSRSIVGRTVNPDELIVLSGAGTILEQLFFALADEGDGVLVPTPSYAGFWADLETRDGLEIVPVPATLIEDPGGLRPRFELGVEELEAALQGATCPVKALLLTTPDNPRGVVLERERVEAILDWAASRELHVVVDEIYALSVFGDDDFASAMTLVDRLGERLHWVWGFSKDFGASGLRCGVLWSENEAVRAAVGELAYWGACSSHTQYLLRRMLADIDWVDQHLAATRRDLADIYATVCVELDAAKIPRVPAVAAFFLLLDLRGWLAAPTWEAEAELWRRLLDEQSINLTPGSACRISEPGFFRLCYAAESTELVVEGVRRLVAALSNSSDR